MKKPVIEDLEDDYSREAGKISLKSPKSPKSPKVRKKRKQLDHSIIRKTYTIRKFQEEYITDLVKKEGNETGRVVNASEILRKIIDNDMGRLK
ncbi:MAG: hypothetical protein RPU13_16765 [Candidatus Sedimenticola sp. (ex Thyasira tokunagai)]